jgi:hypothetical protein
MKTELEKQLVENYPNLFKFHGGDPKETCMAWGCEHDDGWYDLLDNLCSYITALRNRRMYVKLKEGITVKIKDRDYDYDEVTSLEVRFSQIKEKFAGLRIYFDVVNGASEEELSKFDEKSYDKEYERFWKDVSSAVEFTEFLSHKTCEICGKKGKVYRDGWWKTLCENHKGSRREISIDEMP